MKGIVMLYKYIGPAMYGLLPLSVLSMALCLYVLLSLLTGRRVNHWAGVFLSYANQTSVMLGLTGSLLALTQSFNIHGQSAAEIRESMFFVLSAGFYSSIAGVFVSLVSSVGLLALKRF